MNQRTNIGYKIIDSIHIAGTEFVIGYNPKASVPYAIWECLNGDNFYLGHYVNDRTAAERNLLKRATEARNRQDSFASQRLVQTDTTLDAQ